MPFHLELIEEIRYHLKIYLKLFSLCEEKL